MGGILGTTVSTKAEKLAGIRVQTSAYGVVLTVLFGKNRVPAQMLYFNDFTSIPRTTSSSSGKGGVKQKSTTYTYTGCAMFAWCAGPITSYGRLWADKDIYTAANWATYTRSLGVYGQAPWAFLTTNHPTDADPYSGIAYAAKSNYDMGESGTVKNMSAEIVGFNPVNAGVNDNACPADIINQILTNTFNGVSFPGAMLAALDSTSNFYKYCAAQGILLSPAYTQQSPVREHLQKLIEACNSNFVWSDGLLKVIPYADSNVSGSSTGSLVSYTANSTPLYDLTDNDYQPSPGEDPVRLIRKRPADAWNQVQIEFLDSALDYNTNIGEYKDQANIELYGLRTGDPIQMHFITDAALAQLVATLICQRRLYVRNEYQFKLTWRYCLLEPMDLVTLTDVNLGLALKAVRLTSVEEDIDGYLNVTAEEWPFGAASPTLFSVSTGAGYAPDTQVIPGNANPPAIFGPPPALTGGAPQIWLATSGGVNFGGCEVWVSRDAAAYALEATLFAGCRHGVLTALYSGGTLAVDLSQSRGSVNSASTIDANALVAPLWVDGEIMSFTTAALTSAYNYNLTTQNRGAYGTTQQNHLSGAKVVRLDDGVAKFPTPQGVVGGLLSFKLVAFNIYGQALQDISTLSAYTYTIGGGYGAVGTAGGSAPPSGVTIASSSTRPT